MMGDATTRRGFLSGTAGMAALLLVPRALPAAARARPAAPEARALAFANLHTGERLEVAYREGPDYVPEALASLDRLLRDHRTGEVHAIDPGLFDLLYDARAATGGGVFEVISGFRSAATNETLRARSGGIAEKSLHLVGKAIDVRLRGVESASLRRAALRLARGGVGFYPGPDFVHLDTGRVRFW
jgi:uncharacterized protein YcbK (DUF882 family)